MLIALLRGFVAGGAPPVGAVAVWLSRPGRGVPEAFEAGRRALTGMVIALGLVAAFTLSHTL